MNSWPTPPHQSEQEAREKVIEKLESAINDLETAIESANPESHKEQKLQLKRYHEIGYLANQYRKLKRDTDLDDMAEDLAMLKEGDDEGGL